MYISNLAAQQNAKAPRGGVAFDGTTNSYGWAALGVAGSIGTDPFAVAFGIGIPPTVTTLGSIFNLTNIANISNTSLEFHAFYDSTNLYVDFWDSTGSSSNRATWAGVITSFTGKHIQCVVVRPASGTVQLYINGVFQSAPTLTTSGSTPPGWQGSVGSAYLSFGSISGLPSTLKQTYLTLYNLALAQSDALEIIELGGAVPERFKFGSQVNLLTGNNTTFATGLGNWGPGGANSAVAYNGSTFSADVTISPASNRAGLSILTSSVVATNTAAFFAKGTYYRVRGTITNYTDTLQVLIGNRTDLNGTQIGATITANGSFIREGYYYLDGTSNDSSVSPDAKLVTIGQYAAGTYTNAFSAGGIQVYKCGAVAHFSCDDGLGYQLIDASTNKLHATISTSGVTHVIAKPSGVLRFSTSTSGNQQILGQQCLPANVRIRSWVIDAAGATTVSLGNASAGTQFANALVLATGLNDVTPASRFCPTNNLWVNANNTNVLQHTIVFEYCD